MSTHETIINSVVCIIYNFQPILSLFHFFHLTMSMSNPFLVVSLMPLHTCFQHTHRPTPHNDNTPLCSTASAFRLLSILLVSQRTNTLATFVWIPQSTRFGSGSAWSQTEVYTVHDDSLFASSVVLGNIPCPIYNYAVRSDQILIIRNLVWYASSLYIL